jgi:hypothetical protein
MNTLGSTWEYVNEGPGALYLWIEPWAEQYDLSIGACAKLMSPEGTEIGEMERTEDQITIWSSAALLQVFIDGELQASASASVKAPSGLNKAMLGILFENYEDARLGGNPRYGEPRAQWWKRIVKRMGF